jgi:hypothetical protein
MTGDKKVKNITVLNSVTLEATEVDTQAANERIIVDTYYSDQLNLSVQYKTGTGETATTCYIKVWGYIGTKSEGTSYPYSSNTNEEIANDVNSWIQIGTYDISSGTAQFTPTVYKISGGTSATTYTAHFAHGITFSKIRVSAYETGVSSNEGTVTVIASIQ